MELEQIQMKRLFYCCMLGFACTALVAADAEPAKPEIKKAEFHWDFENSKLDKKGIPEGWKYRGKIGTPDVKFELTKDEKLGHQVLKITSDKASGVIMLDASKIDLKKYPIMRWRWKAVKLPTGADATIKAKDDQGIAIFAGYGKISQTSVSYAWQTENEPKSVGHSVYNKLVSVDWTTMRNKKEADGTWFTEEVNLRKDMEKHFKKLPSDWALTISSNSQYTSSQAEVYIDFIEFTEEPSAEVEKPTEKADAK